MQVTFTFDTSIPEHRARVRELLANPDDIVLVGGTVVGADEPAETSSDADKPFVQTARQAAAAKARAAKADKKPGPVEQVLGPNGSDQAEDDDLGMTDPSMSPAEAKEAGLALVREVYAAGHVKNVKDLQKEWKVAKFYDVPMEQGHAFYQRVVKMAVETGVRK